MSSSVFYNIFINSKNRIASEPIHNFSINSFSNNIVFEDTDSVYLSVIEFSMLNTMYNISDIYGNNVFSIKSSDGTETSYIIPTGNYDVNSLASVLNTLLVGLISVSYNSAQNTFTFKRLNLSSSRYYLNPQGCDKILGLSALTEIPQMGISGSYINLCNFEKIILKISNVSVEHYCYDNLSPNDNVIDSTNTIFWVDRNDIMPFQNISYMKNGDGIFTYKILGKSLETFRLMLINEFNQPIIDARDYFVVLQIEVVKKDNPLITALNAIVKQLNDIFELFLMAMNHFGFFRGV